MPRRRRSSNKGSVTQAVVLFILLGFAGLANFWDSLTIQQKWIFSILIGSALIVLIAMVVVFIQYRRRKRVEAWLKATLAWNQNIHSGFVPQFNSAEDLSPQALERFAQQVYKQMGYRASLVGGSGDHGIDVRLVDPKGQVELVQCKQWRKPVGEPEVRDLMGAIMHEKAGKGYLWAPRGFTWAARQWVKGKPILLMDNDEIGKLVESVYQAG